MDGEHNKTADYKVWDDMAEVGNHLVSFRSGHSMACEMAVTSLLGAIR